MGPVVKALVKRGVRTTIVHTGQHFDYEMGMRFVHELGFPKPQYSFRLRESQPAAQIAEIMLKLEKAIDACRPKLMLVQGDTNSMLAAALTAVKTMKRVGHVEAGLRSYDWRMPEEHNRRMVDHVSDYLFAPTMIAAANLRAEMVWGKISVVGNTAIDAVNQYLQKAQQESAILSSIPFPEYVLVTFHRQENVENLQVLRSFVAALTRSNAQVVFPVHPRTRERLHRASLWSKISKAKNVKLLPPVGYFDFVALMKNCRFIASDSGGLQEEATSPKIHKHVLILRDSTERPEAVSSGFAKLVGTDSHEIKRALDSFWDTLPRLPNRSPFGNGSASLKIVHILSRYLSE
jgi:UDP-N-acetylglucosamine 2-epimerase (non-hydrolysing)